MIKLPKIITKLLDYIKKIYDSKILRHKYVRSGNCKGCGRCCQSIYVRHAKNIIKTKEEFELLKTQHFFYNWLNVVDEDGEFGMVFECSKLNKETGKCGAYSKRPLLCRQYPLEEIFDMGGVISDDCGYKFLPIKSFESVLKKIQKTSKC